MIDSRHSADALTDAWLEGGPGAVAGEDFLENHYHKVSDQPDLPFDWDAAARFAKVDAVGRDKAADQAITQPGRIARGDAPR